MLALFCPEQPINPRALCPSIGPRRQTAFWSLCHLTSVQSMGLLFSMKLTHFSPFRDSTGQSFRDCVPLPRGKMSTWEKSLTSLSGTHRPEDLCRWVTTAFLLGAGPSHPPYPADLFPSNLWWVLRQPISVSVSISLTCCLHLGTALWNPYLI